MSRYFFRLLLLAGAAWTTRLEAAPALAAGCCAANVPEPPAPTLAERPSGSRAMAPLAAWMFTAPAVTGLPKRTASSPQFEYRFERHLWLMGGVRTLPTGLPLTPATSSADRTAYSQAGLGLSYGISPAVRAITNWNTGLGPNTVSPGSQFTVGVSLRR